MSLKKIIGASVLASAFALSVSYASAEETQTPPANGQAKDMEKCLGVVKAGMNDCKTEAHSCAAQSKADGDPSEFVLTPKGLCDKLVNGKVAK